MTEPHEPPTPISWTCDRTPIDPDFVPAVAAKREVEYTRLHAAAVKAYVPTRDDRSPDANPDLARLVDADVDGSSGALGVYADWFRTLKIPCEIGWQRDDEGAPSSRYAAVGE